MEGDAEESSLQEYEEVTTWDAVETTSRFTAKITNTKETKKKKKKSHAKKQNSPRRKNAPRSIIAIPDFQYSLSDRLGFVMYET
jgi:hypothetical protein